MSAVVLIVDDEPSICWALERMLRGKGHDVVTASSAEDGLVIAAQRKPTMVLLDVRLPREDGITALPKFIAATDAAPVVIMTAFGDLETAVAAVQRGASDYLIKPFKLEDASRICDSNLQAARLIVKEHLSVLRTNDEPRIVGSSPAIQHVFRQIALVAESDLPVLITGETGTGKELVAAAIHRHSLRADRPYLAVAPVAFNADLIESELFGHVKGAFTGASEDRAGLFELVQGGTVLLDEIGELPIAIQAKLLRVLEQGVYCRVGEMTPRPSNVRILAATNCDLGLAIKEKRFREDLYYRLNGMQIHLPPLRERREDIEPLCYYFLATVSDSAELQLSESLMAELANRNWDGNVRELRNAIGHAAVMARGKPLQLSDFPTPGEANGKADRCELDNLVRHWARDALRNVAEVREPLHAQFLAAAEPALLQVAIEHAGGNRAKAAELLGIHRGTLRERLRGYGIQD